MAKILTTKGSAAALEDIIRRADKEIYIISFSFIISEAFITRLKQATEKGVIVNLVYGKSIRHDSLIKLQAIPKIRIFQFDNLHAKIFANETKCIIGSMNFSEASEINNTELGVMLSFVSDKEAFEDAISHCKDILSQAKPEYNSPEVKRVFAQKKDEGVPHFFQLKKIKEKYIEIYDQSNIPLGYCIRTGKRIPLNHEKPFSVEAYDVWLTFGDFNYPEKYDHFTGEKSDGHTSMSTPILNKNWKKYQKAIF